MTRALTDQEFESIGKPSEWGVLPVRPMGATIRMTKDRRILIRNTAEVHNPFKMSQSALEKRSIKQKIGIKKRFPKLPDNLIQSTWSGIVSRTRNSSQIFEKIYHLWSGTSKPWMTSNGDREVGNTYNCIYFNPTSEEVRSWDECQCIGSNTMLGRL